MESRLVDQLDFLVEVDKLKSTFRQTLLIDKSRQENSAEHSWHLALMAMVLAEYAAEKINLDRVIKMAIVHDLVEVYAGDVSCYDEKARACSEQKEKEAADKLFALLPPEQAKEIRSLWEEFDKAETPDARFASAVDRLQPFLNNYKTDGHSWVVHKVTSDKVYKRINVVKTAIPVLWEFVEFVIRDSIAKGHIIK